MKFELVILNLLVVLGKISSTRDVQEKELQFISHHLREHECRQLVEALHMRDYDIASKIPDGSSTDPGLSCIQLLQHWNNNESRSDSFTQLVHRMKQLGHEQFADRVSRAVFKDLSENAHSAVSDEQKVSTDETILLHNPRPTQSLNEVHISDFDGRKPESSWKSQSPNWTLAQTTLFIISSVFTVGIFGFWFFHCIPDCVRSLCAICRRDPRKNREEAAQMLLDDLDDPDA